MKGKKLKFDRSHGMEFHRELREAVNDYFKSSGLSKVAPTAIWWKISVMLLGYFVPFGLALTVFRDHPIGYLSMFALMGLGMSGIGLNVVHDANHGSVSRKGWVNELLGSLQYLVGVDKATWKQEHNVEHHTFTNIDGHDHDIAAPGFLRFSPNQPWKPIHRFQFLFVWPIYCLVSLRWAISGDFVRNYKNFREGKFQSKTAFRWKMLQLFGWKLFYHAYVWILPALFLPVSPWVAIGGFLLMQAISGLLMSVVFQVAHVMPDARFPRPDDSDTMPSQWAVHQLETTCNFGTDKKLLSFLMGGLNFQIEHHLFPTISHLHYPAISKIVREKARKYEVPYRNYSSFFRAVVAHGKHLYWQGNPAEKSTPVTVLKGKRVPS